MLSIDQIQIPAVSSYFGVYFDNHQLIYRKPQCSKADISTRFFLHVIPTNKSDMPGANGVGFQNMDFDFPKFGEILNGTCVAVRELPPYGINYIKTGQFVRGKGRIWEGTVYPHQEPPIHRKTLNTEGRRGGNPPFLTEIESRAYTACRTGCNAT